MPTDPMSPRTVRFNCTTRTDDDLDWLARAGMTTPRAVSEALLVLFGIVVKHGIEGHLRLDRYVSGVLTVGATPTHPPDIDEPSTRTIQTRLGDDDHVLLAVLAERLAMTAQDVVRHALLVLRTLTEHAELGGSLTPIGSVATT